MSPVPPSPYLLADPVVATLDDYVAHDGGLGLRRSLELGPDATIAEITAAGIRGRGGGGFPAGVKWASVRGRSGGQRYAVCNAGEGEPGTFKDRALLRSNPYRVLEGLLIAAHAVGADEAYIGLKASFRQEIARVTAARDEMAAAGWLGDVGLTVVEGPEEYLFGEEKALLEVIEGNEPLPRWLPPYEHGLFATAPQLGWQAHEPDPSDTDHSDANPTLVNNAETLAQAAWALAHGAAAFRSVGTEESPGTVICTVVGDVDRPGVVEVVMGTPLAEVIARCGGPRPGRTIKAVFAGVANAVITADHLDTPLTHEHMAAIGSGLGSAGFIVYDDSACMVEVVTMLSRFLSVESCGQCPPCKLGSGQITDALTRVRDGGGTEADLASIHRSLRFVTDGNRCYLPVQERAVVASVLQAFPDDFAMHLGGRCGSDRVDIATPKIVDIVDGVVTYDAAQARKRPDWTYADG